MQPPEPHASEPTLDAVKYLPAHVRELIEGYAETSNLSMARVLELAFATFLDHDSVSFGRVDDHPSLGQLREELKILQLKNAALQKALDEAGLPIPTMVPDLSES